MSNTFLALVFASVSQTHDLPPGLLSALCFVESSHRVDAINKDDGKADSLGVCQVQHPTAQVLGYKGTKEGLRDPSINAFYAAKYLKKQIDRYNGNIPFGVAAYNSGRLKLNAAGTPINQKYIKNVFIAWSEGR